jgi:hypothetical protein
MDIIYGLFRPSLSGSSVDAVRFFQQFDPEQPQDITPPGFQSFEATRQSLGPFFEPSKSLRGQVLPVELFRDSLTPQ